MIECDGGVVRDIGAELRGVASAFPTGVTVLTTVTAGRPVGLSANSFTSLSLVPPLILVCIGRSSTTWPAIQTSGRFCVNILGADQEQLARAFADKGADRFAGIAYEFSPRGAPLLPGSLAFIDCTIEQIHDGGDHLVVIAAVDDLGTLRDTAPLVFHRSGFGVSHRPSLGGASSSRLGAAHCR